MKKIKYLLLILLGVGILTSCDYFFEMLGLLDDDTDVAELVGVWEFDNYACFVDDTRIETVDAGSPARFILQNGDETKLVSPDEIWTNRKDIVFYADGTCLMFGNEYNFNLYNDGRVVVGTSEGLLGIAFYLSGNVLIGKVDISGYSAYADKDGVPHVGEVYSVIANYSRKKND